MKKFSFSLETVLGYKRQILDTKMGEYADAQGKTLQQIQKVEDLKEELVKFDEEFRQMKENGITSIDAMRHESCGEVIIQRIQKETQILKKCREYEESKRLELVEARREVSSIEKLREIKEDEYKKQVAKAEETMIDDLIGSRFVKPEY